MCKMHDVCNASLLPYIRIRLLCLVVVFNSPKQSSARPERLVAVLFKLASPKIGEKTQCDRSEVGTNAACGWEGVESAFL